MANTISKEYLSCSEAAKIMGVSRSTVKRYCETGELRNHKTLGQHRRIDPDDIARWLSGQQNKRRKRTKQPKKTRKFPPEYVADCLLSGALKKLDQLVERVVLRQESVANIIDNHLAAAMWEIGKRWQAGNISFVDERRATSNLKLVFRSLYDSIQPVESATKAIGGTLQGDQADIGSMAIELVARSVGIDAYHVGTNLPVATLAQIASQMQVKLVWISYCHIEDVESTLISHNMLRKMLAPEVLLAVGGFALNDELLQSMEYDFNSNSCNQFAEFLAQL